ncbi:MAG: HAMP domain-containing protein [Bacteroidetes bacterium]|nr:HAMP domain-containing protein [Bacteroidota bacterium]
MRIRSLSDKIVLYFVITGITAIALVSTYSFFTSKKALLGRTFDQLTSVRVVKKNQIEQFFQDRLSELTFIVQSEHIREIAKDPTNIYQYQYLWEYLRTGGYYKGIYIQPKSGKTIVCKFIDQDSVHFEMKQFQSNDPVRKIIQRIPSSGTYQIHDYIIDPSDNSPRMFISGSLPGKGYDESLNVVLEISLSAINGIMLEQNPADGMGLSGESYLVGPDGLMRSTSRFRNESMMRTRVNTDAVMYAYEDKTGTSVIEDYRNIKVLSSYSKLDVPNLDWVILTEIDYTEATRSIYFIRNNILILTIFVAIVVLIISFIFSKRITLPLIKLTDATANIRGGNLDVDLPRIKNDEIGQLTHSFNGMAASLREKDSELKAERNKRITAMIDGEEHERQRLSRELHDGLGQSLIALKLKLEGIDGRDIGVTNKTLKEAKTSCDDTISEIRRISNDLMPAVLIEFGLITALKNIGDDITENTKTAIHFNYSGKFNDFDNRMTIYLFRIIQEALHNIVKHADASIAEVKLERKPKLLRISIEDNGKGLLRVENSNLSGNGIPNMRERVRLLKGDITINSDPGKGTKIIVEVPLNADNHEID